MALTVTQCADWIRLSLGNAPGAPLSTLEIVNQAGSQLCSMRAWKWLEGRTGTLDTVASQNYVSLPADFASAVALEVATRPCSVAWVTRTDMDRLRAGGNPSGISGMVSVVVSTAAATDSTPPTPVLEISPTDSASTSGFFTLSYRAGWTNLEGDGSYVPIPQFCETLFKLLLGVFAQGYVRDQVATLSARLAELESGLVYRNAIRDDRNKQTNYGQIKGAIPDYSTYVGPWVIPTTTTGP